MEPSIDKVDVCAYSTYSPETQDKRQKEWGMAIATMRIAVRNSTLVEWGNFKWRGRKMDKIELLTPYSK